MSRAAAAAFLTIHVNTLDRLVKAGRIPAPCRLGARRVWSRAVLTAFLSGGGSGVIAR